MEYQAFAKHQKKHTFGIITNGPGIVFLLNAFHISAHTTIAEYNAVPLVLILEYLYTKKYAVTCN